MDDAHEGTTTLRALLAEAVAGKGRIAMVTGAVATGKSESLYLIAEHALDQGALPLTATGSPAESGLPLGVLSQLLHHAPLPAVQRAAALGLLHEGARRQLAGEAAAESIEHVDAQIVHALCAVLLELAGRRPLVITVDDVHHADRASQLCLAYLARRIRFAGVLLVFGVPDHSPHLRTLFHTDVLRQPHCRPVRLTHLSREGVDARLGADAAHRFGELVHTLSGGNRLLVDALLEDLQATGVPGDRYGEAVLACVRRLGPCAQEAAYGLAVLGEPGSISRLLGLGESEAVVAKSLQAMAGAGLLDGGRFRHEAARSAVLAELDAADRIHLHRRAAELAHRDGASADVVAGHLAQAGHAGDPWALSALEEAARLALREDGVESAIEYLRLAWRACDDERRRARIGTALVRAEWRIDPGTPAGHLAGLTDALHKGHLGGGETVVLAKALLWHGHTRDALDVLGRLGELREPDRETAAELAAARPWFRALYPSFLPHLPNLPEAGAPPAPALGVGRRIQSAGVLADVLTGGPGDETVAAAEHILRGCRLDEVTMDTVETALLALTYTDRPGRAAPWCDAFIAEAEARRAPSRQARLSAIRAEIRLREGDLAAAAGDARRALEIIPAGSWGVAVGGPLGTLLLAGAAMGRLDDCLPEVNLPVPEAMLETRYGLHYLRGRGRLNLAAGRPGQALRDFRSCGELMTRWDLDAPGFIAWRLDAAEALIALGGHEEAGRLVREQLSRCGPRSQRVRGSALRLLAAVSEGCQRPPLLRQAADLLQEGGDRYEYARLLCDLTEAYQAAGEHRRAGMLRQRARAMAKECHAEPLTRALAGRDEPAAGVPAQLSDAERRVAELAAKGHTNVEIATRLYITVSTVEQHLTRVFRKLNVSRRTELPATLAEVG
ncbi:AAA family ATPase [Herbidospora cretacea]|uniref:AAA family ATPase n=1 Tax=Herbidospora cretacea TaxID=28444 RepID=UPI0004C2DC9E|nr:LuxR family transcriptional regulator [Herbidospora cretacea]